MMILILAMLTNSAPSSLTDVRTTATMVYASAQRGVIRHRDCAADHPDRFTSSERTIAIVGKGGL